MNIDNEYIESLQSEVKLRNFICDLRAMKAEKDILDSLVIDKAIARLTKLADTIRHHRMYAHRVAA